MKGRRSAKVLPIVPRGVWTVTQTALPWGDEVSVYVCPTCRKVFKSISIIREHVKSTHMN